MFLDYGVDNNGELVWVGQVGRGASALHCPYCNGLLTAKKGSLIAHHFAHSGETCRQAERNQDAIALPAYDNFNLHLAPKVLAELRKFDTGVYRRDWLEQDQLVKVGFRGHYELTHKGKLVLGQLSLKLFNDFQAPLIAERHDELVKQAKRAYSLPAIQARLETARTLVTALEAKHGPIWTGNTRYSEPLRKTLAQAQSDTKDRKINGNVRWEKLCALGVLEVDQTNKDDVFVRRGSEWEAWAASRADLTHGLQMLKYGARCMVPG